MQFAQRSVTALAVVGVLGLLAAGCSAGGDAPTPSPSRSASTTTTPAPTSTAATPTTTPSTGSGASGGGTATGGGTGGDDGVPTAFPGTGQTSQPDTDPKDFPATAVVTFSGWDAASSTLQAGGLVSGTTDASGSCTFTATKSGVSRMLTSQAAASASSVSCAQVAFPKAQVSSGTWSISLKYTVGSKSTTSDPMTAEVP